MFKEESLKLEDIRFQDVKSIKNYVLGKNKRPLLIYGPSGTGKTASVYAIADELDYEVVEANASDFRDKNSINSIVGSALNQVSLFKQGKIILIDELEGFSGNADRGGIKAILDIAENSNFPVVVTTSDIEDERVDEIKNKFMLLEYKKLPPEALIAILELACKKETLLCGKEDLSALARISDGDARKALINLCLVADNNRINRDCIKNIEGFAKDGSNEALLKLFKSSNLGIVAGSFNNLDCEVVDISKKSISPVLFDSENCLIYSIEENLPYEYDHASMERAFRLLSKADIFRKRIFNWQYYRYLVYISAILAAISLAKDSKNARIMQYRKTSRSPKNNKKLWWLVNRKKKNIAGKIADYTHASRKKVMKDFGYYKLILANNPIKELTEEEIEYLNS